MRVVIIGGGLGGMATAVRLAKIGHAVTLVEAASRMGGAIGTVTKPGNRVAFADGVLIDAAGKTVATATGSLLEFPIAAAA